MPHITGHTEEVVQDHDGVVAQRSTVSRADGTYSEQVAVVDRGRRWYEFDLAGRINTVAFAVLAGIETLLALRFTFFAFGANPNSGFVDFIYDFSGFFMEPFENAFRNRTWDEGIIEVNALLAMGIYALCFAVFAILIAAIVPRVGGYYDDGTGSTYRRSRVSHTGGH
jgi:hypothetical protein